MAKQRLKQEPFDLSDEQADAILSLRLTRLTAMEDSKLREESKELAASIARLSSVMSTDEEVYAIIVAETKVLQNKYGIPRRAVIWKEESSFSEQDLTANARSVIVMTHSGYVKRLPIDEFEAQSRGSKGKAGTKLSADDDSVANFFSCNDHDSLLFVTNKGN